MRNYILMSVLFFLAACAGTPAPQGKQPLILKQAGFEDLPGWSQQPDEVYDGAAAAFEKSCARIQKADPAKKFGPVPEAGTYGQWQPLCEEFKSFDKPDAIATRRFFEKNFTPYAAYAGTSPEGLFTGYYEASLRGSLKPDDVYRYPLHARPDDLVMVDLGQFREELKGQRIAGRVIEGNLKPYEDRASIVAGDWPHNDKTLVWVDDPVDAFFVQVQGSGAVKLADNSVMRIGYAGQNGHPYYAIGKELIARGELTKENVSMDSIRDWLATHPDEADEIMNTNKSYVFFRELGIDGPEGGEGIALTPLHSLAVDRSLIPYGVPLWVDIDYPSYGKKGMKNLMVAQDTGGAIAGPVRGDVFWGYGDYAEQMAGPMKAKGRYWLLLPKTQ